KITGKAKILKERKKLGSPSIVNEMLYKRLTEQQNRRKVEEASEQARKEAEDEAKKKSQ
ncbi:hypothetical protein Tco_1249959, partial [Tanacetum coccineum]